MMKVTPSQLAQELDGLIEAKIMDPVLVLGKSGIGKSAIVRQVLERRHMTMWDVRWGQLAPVDARGVPGIDRETGKTKFYTPDFWPDKGPGAIHLDEFNMATPTMMGLGQQLLLDRAFGNYKVPHDVFVWASGNEKQHFAAVNEIPAPVNNRFQHYELVLDFDDWETWAYGNSMSSSILGFLKARSELLHKFNPEERAWPSPRSWEIADRRVKAGMSVAPAVGEAVAGEFEAHMLLLKEMPNIELVAKGQGSRVEFPDEPSLKFVTMAELVRFSLKDWDTFVNVFKWMAVKANQEPEWTSTLVQDVMRVLTANDRKKKSEYVQKIQVFPEARVFIREHTQSSGVHASVGV